MIFSKHLLITRIIYPNKGDIIDIFNRIWMQELNITLEQLAYFTDLMFYQRKPALNWKVKVII